MRQANEMELFLHWVIKEHNTLLIMPQRFWKFSQINIGKMIILSNSTVLNLHHSAP